LNRAKTDSNNKESATTVLLKETENMSNLRREIRISYEIQ
jgi:hypothetical protein